MVVCEVTRTRLLEAAGEEFAAKGFEAATVRAICERAGANLAAVNYHFGGKESLYVEALLEAHRCGAALISASEFDTLAPAEQLARYIQHFLGNVLALRGEPTWHQALMLREMLQPTRALETLVDQSIRPRFERLIGILRRVCPEADDRKLSALAFSVIGQCLHYKMAQPVSERLVGPEAYARLDLEYLAGHITGFCLAALGLAPPLNRAGVSREGKEPSAPVLQQRK